jgi:hypothetical protein
LNLIAIITEGLDVEDDGGNDEGDKPDLEQIKKRFS